VHRNWIEKNVGIGKKEKKKNTPFSYSDQNAGCGCSKREAGYIPARLSELFT
jgi:hypothetical protein